MRADGEYAVRRYVVAPNEMLDILSYRKFVSLTYTIALEVLLIVYAVLLFSGTKGLIMRMISCSMLLSMMLLVPVRSDRNKPRFYYKYQSARLFVSDMNAGVNQVFMIDMGLYVWIILGCVGWWFVCGHCALSGICAGSFECIVLGIVVVKVHVDFAIILVTERKELVEYVVTVVRLIVGMVISLLVQVGCCLYVLLKSFMARVYEVSVLCKRYMYSAYITLSRVCLVVRDYGMRVCVIFARKLYVRCLLLSSDGNVGFTGGISVCKIAGVSRYDFSCGDDHLLGCDDVLVSDISHKIIEEEHCVREGVDVTDGADDVVGCDDNKFVYDGLSMPQCDGDSSSIVCETCGTSCGGTSMTGYSTCVSCGSDKTTCVCEEFLACSGCEYIRKFMVYLRVVTSWSNSDIQKYIRSCPFCVGNCYVMMADDGDVCVCGNKYYCSVIGECVLCARIRFGGVLMCKDIGECSLDEYANARLNYMFCDACGGVCSVVEWPCECGRDVTCGTSGRCLFCHAFGSYVESDAPSLVQCNDGGVGSPVGMGDEAGFERVDTTNVRFVMSCEIKGCGCGYGGMNLMVDEDYDLCDPGYDIDDIDEKPLARKICESQLSDMRGAQVQDLLDTDCMYAGLVLKDDTVVETEVPTLFGDGCAFSQTIMHYPKENASSLVMCEVNVGVRVNEVDNICVEKKKRFKKKRKNFREQHEKKRKGSGRVKLLSILQVLVLLSLVIGVSAFRCVYDSPYTTEYATHYKTREEGVNVLAARIGFEMNYLVCRVMSKWDMVDGVLSKFKMVVDEYFETVEQYRIEFENFMYVLYDEDIDNSEVVSDRNGREFETWMMLKKAAYDGTFKVRFVNELCFIERGLFHGWCWMSA